MKSFLLVSTVGVRFIRVALPFCLGTCFIILFSMKGRFYKSNVFVLSPFSKQTSLYHINFLSQLFNLLVHRNNNNKAYI